MTIWNEIQSSIQTAGFPDFIISIKQPVSGGDICQSFQISDGTQRFFVKIKSPLIAGFFEQEKLGLQTLARAKSFVIPKAIASGYFQNSSFLVLNFIDFASSGSQASFANSLAKMHGFTAEQFGFSENNFIGMTVQANRWNSDWGLFFTQHRLLPQFKMLIDSYRTNQLVKNISNQMEQVLTVCLGILNQHLTVPSLVHGDLWQGNYGFDQSGKPVLYDPACYFADPEVDLAMLELFGSPGASFYTSYQHIHPVKTGYEIRKLIYNLYHLLNHANLFGSSYFSRVELTLSQLNKY